MKRESQFLLTWAILESLYSTVARTDPFQGFYTDPFPLYIKSWFSTTIPTIIECPLFFSPTAPKSKEKASNIHIKHNRKTINTVEYTRISESSPSEIVIFNNCSEIIEWKRLLEKYFDNLFLIFYRYFFRKAFFPKHFFKNLILENLIRNFYQKKMGFCHQNIFKKIFFCSPCHKFPFRKKSWRLRCLAEDISPSCTPFTNPPPQSLLRCGAMMQSVRFTTR